MKTPCRVRVVSHCTTLALGFGLWTIATAAHALLATCAVSTTGLVFGTYQPLTFAGKLTSSDKTSTATVTVACSGLLQLSGYTLSLGPGNYGPGDRISNRYLNNTTQSSNFMAFNIFTDASYTSIWGNGTSGSLINGNTPLIIGSSTLTHTVYGKIPAGQSTLKAGSFSDSLTITLTYNP